MSFSDSHVLGKYLGQPSESIAKAEELKAAYDRIARLEADLVECLEYFQDKYDVVDGDYGEPSPNTEMRLGSMIQEALYGPGGF